jgi:SAM-dependent methyltransferase
MLDDESRGTDESEFSEFTATDREISLLKFKRRVLSPIGRARMKMRAPELEPNAGAPVEVPFRRPNSVYDERSEHLDVHISEYSYYREVLHVEGWVLSQDQIVGLGFVSQRGEAVQVVDVVDHPLGEVLTFQFDISEPDRGYAATTPLTVEFASGSIVAVEGVAGRALAADPVHALTRRFHEEVRSIGTPNVLEVGSRARSGNIYRSWLPDGSNYVGLDILPGENVDVVGDAHRLSAYLTAESFDAVVSVSTMEHLAMPWVVVTEMNRVLRPGGLVYVGTHQTWPVHDSPWDFYRFSEYSWVTLFNKYSGFEIVATAAGEPGKVVANVVHGATNGLEMEPAFLSSAVLARKVSSTDLTWAAEASEVVSAAYPR